MRYVGTEPGFFLWKKPLPEEATFDDACRVVKSQDEMLRILEGKLQEQAISQVLRDEHAHEPRRSLFKNEASARKRLLDASSVLVLEDVDGTVQAAALIGSEGTLQTSFDVPNQALPDLDHLLQDTESLEVVHIDVLVSNRCAKFQSAHRLLGHLFATFPTATFVMHCPPVLTTLQFYEEEGFVYNDLRSSSSNLLPFVTQYLADAVRMWNSGTPAFTYAFSQIELPRVRVSVYTGSFEEATDAVPKGSTVLRVNKTMNMDDRIASLLDRNKSRMWLFLETDVVGDADFMRRMTDIVHHRLATDWRVDHVTYAIHESHHGSVAHAVYLRPLPESNVCMLDSPVPESELRIQLEHQAGLEAELGEELEAQQQVYDDEGVEYEPYEEFEPDPPEQHAREYLYDRKGQLRMRRAAEVVEFILSERGIRRVDMVRELEHSFAQALGVPIERGLKAFGFVQQNRIKYACLYRPSEGRRHAEIVRAICEEDD